MQNARPLINWDERFVHLFKRISDQSEVAVGEILDVEGLRAVVGRCCGL